LSSCALAIRTALSTRDSAPGRSVTFALAVATFLPNTARTAIQVLLEAMFWWIVDPANRVSANAPAPAPTSVCSASECSNAALARVFSSACFIMRPPF
jgi:hypothetical protein